MKTCSANLKVEWQVVKRDVCKLIHVFSDDLLGYFYR